MTDDIARRLDRIETEFELRRLAHRYCQGIDEHDLELFLDIWHEDAVWDTGPMFGTFSGRSAIGGALTDIMWPAFRSTHHWTVNFIADIDGHRARSRSELTFNGATADGITMLIAGTYHDEFERRNGRWRIARRRVTLHHAAPLPGVELAPKEERG